MNASFTCSTTLHSAIFSKNQPVFSVLLEKGKPDLEIKNSDGHTALWLALQQVGPLLFHQVCFCLAKQSIF